MTWGAPSVISPRSRALDRVFLELTMPKMKTNRAAAKRFKVTGSGKVRRPKGGAQHNMIGKSRGRRRRLRDNDMVTPALQKRVKILLPYG